VPSSVVDRTIVGIPASYRSEGQNMALRNGETVKDARKLVLMANWVFKRPS